MSEMKNYKKKDVNFSITSEKCFNLYKKFEDFLKNYEIKIELKL